MEGPPGGSWHCGHSLFSLRGGVCSSACAARGSQGHSPSLSRRLPLLGGGGAQGLQAGRSQAVPLAPHEALPSADKDVGSCPKSQTFLYNLTTCQQTCRSLSEPDTHCLEGFVPVDGCGCPDHTFLDEKSRCVPLAQCSCYHRGLYLEAGEVVLRQEERWWVSGPGRRAWGSPQLRPAPPSHGACAPRQPRSPPRLSQRLPEREAAVHAGHAAQPE